MLKWNFNILFYHFTKRIKFLKKFQGIQKAFPRRITLQFALFYMDWFSWLDFCWISAFACKSTINQNTTFPQLLLQITFFAFFADWNDKFTQLAADQALASTNGDGDGNGNGHGESQIAKVNGNKWESSEATAKIRATTCPLWVPLNFHWKYLGGAWPLV